MIRTSVLIALFFCVCGAAQAQAKSASVEMSYDGLQRRDSKVFEHLWVRQYFDVRSYRKIIFMAPHIEYRPVMKDSGQSAESGFALTKRQKDSLYEILSKAFETELAKSKSFTLTTEPGSDVLIVRGDLLDVTSFVPPSANGRNDLLTVAEIGEATLVMELYDSLSDSIMVRAIERVKATHDPSAPPTTAADAVQRTATQWARILRERLDAAASIPINR